MPKRKAEVMPNRTAKASTSTLPKACFRGCGPGQLLLTEEEFKMVQKELERVGMERLFKLVPMSDLKEPPKKKAKQKGAKQSKASASSATKRHTEQAGTSPKRRRREHTQEEEVVSPRTVNEDNDGNEETESSEMHSEPFPGGEEEVVSPGTVIEGNDSNEETESSEMHSEDEVTDNELDELLENITEAQVAIVGKAFNLRPEGPEAVGVLDIDNFSARKRRRLKKMLEGMVKENMTGPDGQNDQAAVTRSPQTQRCSPPEPIPAPVTTAPPVTSAASGSAPVAGSAAPASGAEAATEAHASAEPQQNSAEDDEELRKFLDECDEWM